MVQSLFDHKVDPLKGPNVVFDLGFLRTVLS